MRATLASAILFSASIVHGQSTISPDSPTIPGNLLRFVVTLDEPGLDFTDFRLEVDGRIVDGAFLDVPPVVSGRRIVLLLHPGRVKAGLGARQALGRAFEPGQLVTLSAAGARRTWRVTADDVEGPTLDRWSISVPKAGTRDAFIARMEAPADALLAHEMMAIAGPNGLRLAGQTELGAGDLEWRFRPEQPWAFGVYSLRLHPDIEDPSGNKPCAPFEQGLGAIDCAAVLLREFEPQ